MPGGTAALVTKLGLGDRLSTPSGESTASEEGKGNRAMIPCLESSWGEWGCLHLPGLVPESRKAGGVGGLPGPRLTCGVVPHHEEEGSVHDDLLGGHSG